MLTPEQIKAMREKRKPPGDWNLTGGRGQGLANSDEANSTTEPRWSPLMLTPEQIKALRTLAECGMENRTHYEGCWTLHPCCALSVTLDELELYQEYYLAVEENARLCDTVGVTDQEWADNDARMKRIEELLSDTERSIND